MEPIAAELPRKDESFSGDQTSGSSYKPENSAVRPICLDDVTDSDDFPESYLRVKSFFTEVELSSNQSLAIALYIMAVESGFTSDVEDDVLMNERVYTFDSRRVKCISPQFVTSGMINDAEYTFPLYLGSSKKSLLRIQPFLGKFLVNLFRPDSLICFSKIIDVSSYVTADSRLNKTKLKELSTTCKNDLFYPMKSFCLHELGIKHACLLDLPYEVIVFTVKYIDVEDFLHLCASCRFLYDNYVNDEAIRNFYKKKKRRGRRRTNFYCV